MEIFTPKDKKVELKTFNAGYPSQAQLVKKHLEIGKQYTVEKTIVHDWSSEVYLKEFPDISFNTVFFKNVDKVSQEEIKEHPDQAKYQPLQ